MSFGFGGAASNKSAGSNAFSFGGSSNASPSPFGGAATNNTFGATAAPGTSMFGNANTSTFGNTAKPPASGGFGGFGSMQPASTGFGNTGSMFGATNNAANTNTGFGSTSTFGTGNATGFAASTGTSAFGATNTPSPFAKANPSSPFGNAGVFGGTQNNATTSFGSTANTGFGSTFGASNPSSGTNTFGGGGTFGATKSAFGAGTGSSAFGATGSNTSSWGGAQTGGFGSVANGVGQQVGTGNPPYQVTRENSTAGNSNYISISRMNAYSRKSVEELRYEDYLKLTNPTAAAAAAQLPDVVNTPAITNSFGSTPGGLNATQPSSGNLFGNANTGSTFGTNTGFGANAAQNKPFNAAGGQTFGSSTFGSSTFGAQPTANTGMFSSNNTGFGSNTNTASTFGGAGTGAFGSGMMTTAPTGATGASNAFGAPNTAGGATFGSSASQPAAGGFGFGGGFGANTNTGFNTGGFGSTASTFGKPAGATGFGATNTAPAGTSNFFSGTSGSAFGAPAANNATSSIFGANNAGNTSFSFNGANTNKPAGSGSAFGDFGTNNTGAFGSTQAPACQSAFGGTTGGFGGFGTQNTLTNNANSGATGNLFGTTKPGGLFGSTTNNFSSLGGTTGNNTSLFGGTGTGGNTFGNFGSTGTFGSNPSGSNTNAFSFGTGGTPSAFGTNTASTNLGGMQSSFNTFGNTNFGAFSGANSSTPATNQPTALVAAPDVSPYGCGSFGDGLVEQTVKAALDAQSIKVGSRVLLNNSRIDSFAKDLGLHRGPMCSQLPASARRLLGRAPVRRPITMSPFKSPFTKSTSSASAASAESSHKPSSFQYNKLPSKSDNEFGFTKSLFRKHYAKKLIINRDNSSRRSIQNRSQPASVIPIEEPSKALDTLYEKEKNMEVNFKYGADDTSFTLSVSPDETLSDVQPRIAAFVGQKTDENILFVWKGSLQTEDATKSRTFSSFQLQKGDSIDVILAESTKNAAFAKARDISDEETVMPSMPARFMSYDQCMTSAMQESAPFPTRNHVLNHSHPILTKMGYYTEPSYGKLFNMSDQELARVESFTVGCYGLGSVEWIGYTDVRNLDLDELVIFEKKEVIVYMNDETKHPLGQGLNKPAIVELLGIFPSNKSASNKEEIAKKYRERVIQRTKEIGAEFLDYSETRGAWRFRVEHFSRYGLTDDDDQEMDQSAQDAVNAQQRAVTDVRMEIHAGNEEMMDAEQIARYRKPLIQRMTQGRNWRNRFENIVVKSADGFTDRTQIGQTEYSHRVSKRFPLSDCKNVLDRAREDRTLTDKDFYNRLIDAEQDPTDENTCLTCHIPKAVSSLKSFDFGSETLESERSLTYQLFQKVTAVSGAVRNEFDYNVFMGRSFRCSWGPQGQLAYCGKLLSPGKIDRDCNSMHFAQVRVATPLQLARGDKIRREELRDALNLHRQCAVLHREPSNKQNRQDAIAKIMQMADEDSVPLFEVPSGEGVTRCLMQYDAYGEKKLKSGTKLTPENRHIVLLWKLLQALWGQESDSSVNASSGNALAAYDDARELETLETYQMVDLRREAISRWFEIAISIQQETMENAEISEENVLHLLCHHRIAEAAEMAAEVGDFRLSTLIAQVSTFDGTDFRRLLGMQLSDWENDSTLNYFHDSRILIYSLLGGAVEALTEPTSLQLPWLNALALFFWYKRGPSMSLKSALLMYLAAFKKNLAPSSKIFESSEYKDDILMEVMKLYAEEAVSLCSVLSASGFLHGRKMYLDYEVSWHLHSVLRAIGYQIDRIWESHIHHNFIRQLESEELWQEALYVALNISDVTEREACCRDILCRNAISLNAMDAATMDAELVQKLKIPQQWIGSALAVLARANSDPHAELEHWLAALAYGEAHCVFVKDLAPKLFFTNDKQRLVQLLEDMEPYAACIPQWDSCQQHVGGGIWLEYLRLELVKVSVMDGEDAIAERVLSLALKMKNALRERPVREIQMGLKADYMLARACISSMLVNLTALAVSMKKLLNSAAENEAPKELEIPFLSKIALVSGHEKTHYMETFHRQRVFTLCSSYIETFG